METRIYKAGSLILPQSKKSPVNEEYKSFYSLYRHKILNQEYGESSLSNIQALCQGISKYKSAEFRSKIVENICKQNKKIKNLKKNISNASKYYDSPESFDEEPEGVYIIYQGSCDIIDKIKGEDYHVK